MKTRIKLLLVPAMAIAMLALGLWFGLVVSATPAYADDGSAPADETAIVDETAPADETATVDEKTPADETAIVDETTPPDETAIVDETAPADETTATIQTDLAAYLPTDTPVITGTGFTPGSTVDVTVTAPDGTTTTFTATTDSEGNWTTTYTGPMGDGTFSVTATDGSSTAGTTFADAFGIEWVKSSNSASWDGSEDDSFSTTDNVYAYIKTSGGTGTATVRIYVTANTQWDSGDNGASLTDISGGYETVTLTADTSTDYFGPYLIWSANTSAGSYDIVVDVDHDGVYDHPSNALDKVDNSGTPAGFTVTVQYSVTFYFADVGTDVSTHTDMLNVKIGGGSWTTYEKHELADTYYITLSGISSGTTVQYEYYSTVASTDSGKQYAWDSTSGTGSASGQTGRTGSFNLTSNSTVTAAYDIQYKLTVNDDISGKNANFQVTYTLGGTTKTNEAHTTQWWTWTDSGTGVTVSNPQTPISGGSDTQYVFDDYSPSASVTMTSAKTITLEYITQGKVTVNDNLPGSLNADFLVTYTQSGTTYTNQPHTTNWTEWVDDNTWVYVSSPESPISDGPGTRYVFKDYTPLSGSILIQCFNTITINYNTQYLLTMATNFGTTSPSVGVENWYDAGAKVYISATAPFAGPGEQYVWNGWTGTGASGKYTGLINDILSSHVHMNGPITETASWTHQYQVIFDQTGLDSTANSTVVTVNGTPHNYATPHLFQIWVDATTGSVTYFYAATVTSSNAGTQFVLTTPAPSPAPPITGLTGPVTVTANYQTQYLVSFHQTGLDSDAGSNTVLTVGLTNYVYVNFPINNIWVDSGTTYSYSDPVSSTVTGKRFDLTSVTGLTSPITGPGTVTGNYHTEYYLTVNSAHDTPGGQGWYDSGATPSATLTDGTVSGGAGTQYVFTGWTGDTSGTGLTSDPITMDGPKTATADWTTQYYLTVTSLYGTTDGEDWYNAGTDAFAYVTPLSVPEAGGTYDFASWAGDATGATSPSDPITMTGPMTANANWTFTPTPLALAGAAPRVLVLSIDWFGIVRYYRVTAAGVLLEDVNITSPDGTATLTIPVGTLVLDADGLPLYLHRDNDITVTTAGTPAAPAGTTFAAVYELLPSGVIFEHGEAGLIVTYDPATVPTGSVLVIAYYDEATGEWVEIDTAGYVVGGETVSNTVVGHFAHFTYFALLVKLPA